MHVSLDFGCLDGDNVVEGNEWEGEGGFFGGTWLEMYGTRRDKYTNNPEVSLLLPFFFNFFEKGVRASRHGWFPLRNGNRIIP